MIVLDRRSTRHLVTPLARPWFRVRADQGEGPAPLAGLTTSPVGRVRELQCGEPGRSPRVEPGRSPTLLCRVKSGGHVRSQSVPLPRARVEDVRAAPRRGAQPDDHPTGIPPEQTRPQRRPAGPHPGPGNATGERVRGDGRRGPGGLNNPTTNQTSSRHGTLDNGRPGLDSRLPASDHENCVKVVVTTLRDGTRAFGGAPPQGTMGTHHAAPRAALLRERNEGRSAVHCCRPPHHPVALSAASAPPSPPRTARSAPGTASSSRSPGRRS